MTSNEKQSERGDVQPIPEAQQDISTEEIVQEGYEVVLQSEVEGNRPSPQESNTKNEPRGYPVHGPPPGRTGFDDSVDASSEQLGGTDHGHEYSAGYDSNMATRIGDEETPGGEADRLRQLHEGRHPSDGEHSTREHHRDKTRIAQALCTALPLAKHERKEVVNVVEQLDLESLGHHRQIARGVLGTVVVLVDERHRQSLEEPREFVQWSDEFRLLCDQNDISMSDLSSIKKSVREALDSGKIRIGSDWIKRDPALPRPTPPEELTDEFWDELSPERWTGIARGWETAPEDFKEAISDEYQSRLQQIRRWEPWNRGEKEEKERTISSIPSPATEPSKQEPDASIDEEVVEEVLREAEELVADLDSDNDAE